MTVTAARKTEPTTTTATPDFEAIKTKQRSAWGSGDYAVVGSTLNLVGEMLAETMDIGPCETVLDVAAGNGNATLAAARRGARVTSTDYVASLLERGKRRMEADGFDAVYEIADAERLPYAGASFNKVISTFGVMFTPDQRQAAREMMRVCRRGGMIGTANWTPDSFIGALFKTVGKHVPPPAGAPSPANWGDEAKVRQLFDGTDATVAVVPRTFTFRYESVKHWVDVFRRYYGPTHKAFQTLDEPGAAALEQDMIDLADSKNAAYDGRMIVPSEYLEVIVKMPR